MTKRQSFTLVGILIIAAALRFFQLGSVPYGVNQDEADRAYEAYSLLHTGHDQHGNYWPLTLEAFSKYRDNASAISTYTALPFVALLGPTLFAVRLPSAIAGILAVLAIIFIGSYLSGRKSVGLLAGFLLAVSPWHLTLSRVGHEAIWAPTLFLLGLLAWLHGLRKPVYFFLASLCWVAALYGYPIAKLFIPFVILLLIILSWRTLKRHWPWVLGAAIFGIILLLPLLMLQLRHSTDAGRLQQIMIFTNHQGGFWLRQLLENFWVYLNPWTWLTGQLSVGLLDIAAALLGVTLFFFLVRPSESFPHPRIFISILLVLTVLPAIFMNGGPHQLRAAFLLGPLHLAAAWGFMLGWVRIRGTLNIKTKHFALGVIGIIAASIGIWLFWQPGYTQNLRVTFIFTPEIETVVHRVQSRYLSYSEVRFVDYGTSQPYIFFALFTPWDPLRFQQDHIFSPRIEDNNWYRTTRLGRISFCKPQECNPLEKGVLFISLSPYNIIGSKELERIPWQGSPGLAWRFSTN